MKKWSIGCVLIVALALPSCNRKPEQAAPPTTDTAATNGTTVTSTDAGLPPPEIERIPATPEAVQQAQQQLADLADRNRRMHATLTFEEFEAEVFKEPFAGGKYIVNGDTPIANEKLLREFYEENVKTRQRTRLVVDQISGMDNKWSTQQQRQLKYCVSTAFGPRHAEVVRDMNEAAAAWEAAAAVDFIHDTAQDTSCNASNTAVVFDVNPVNVGGEYLARAFFPNEGRSSRNVLIDESSFEFNPQDTLKLVGILRHELGHTIGFRHEHTRPDSGKCFEDHDWRPLSSYDAFSVMHYPQCNGKGDWSLTLTGRDKNGVACLYGPAQGFTLDPTLVTSSTCAPAPATAAPGGTQPQTESFNAQTVAREEEKRYGPFAVQPGSPLEVNIGGATASGDADLYVRFDQQPRVRAFDCRPFLDASREVCSLTVPSNASRVFLMVRGFTAATFDLQVTRVAPPSI
jgi:serine protease